MLKYAYQLGMKTAFAEAGIYYKTAVPANIARRSLGALRGLWNAPGGKSKLLLGGAGLGLGALGVGGAMAMQPDEEPSWLEQLGETARGVVQHPQFSQGLSALAGGLTGGQYGGGFNAAAPGMGGGGSFPPPPDMGQGDPYGQYGQYAQYGQYEQPTSAEYNPEYPPNYEQY